MVGIGIGNGNGMEKDESMEPEMIGRKDRDEMIQQRQTERVKR